MNQFSNRSDDLSKHVIPRDLALGIGLYDDLSLANFTTNLGTATLLPGEDTLRARFTELGDLEFTLSPQPALANLQKEDIRRGVFDLAMGKAQKIPEAI